MAAKRGLAGRTASHGASEAILPSWKHEGSRGAKQGGSHSATKCKVPASYRAASEPRNWSAQSMEMRPRFSDPDHSDDRWASRSRLKPRLGDMEQSGERWASRSMEFGLLSTTSSNTEDEWLSRTLAAMPKSPVATPPYVVGRPRLSAAPKAGGPGPGQTGTSSPSRAWLLKPVTPPQALQCRPTTPNSVWQAKTLATLASSQKSQGATGTAEVEAAVRHLTVQRAAASRPEGRSGSSACSSDAADESIEELKLDSNSMPGLSRQQMRQRRSSIKKLRASLPDVDTVLARIQGSDKADLSKGEKARMKAISKRFRFQDSNEIHKDDLSQILKHLGFIHVKDEDVKRIATETSQYASMDESDFYEFMARYGKYEHAQFKEVFDAFDEDGNGELDKEEILKFLTHLGYTPLRSTIKEAMHLVDLNEDGTLQFEEVVLLMHLYRNSEGFSQGEVQRFTTVFEEEQRRMIGFTAQAPAANDTTDDMVPAARLTTLLTTFFGPAHASKAATLAKELGERARGVDEAGGGGPPLGLSVSEALVWARRLRDKEFESYRQAFTEADSSGDGIVDFEELKELCAKLGFTLTDAAIDAMIEKAKERGEWHDLANDHELDYDAFVHFMRVLHERDGFTDAEMEEITATFVKFDEDGSKDMDVIELNDMLHHMGFTTHIDEVLVLLSRIDYNSSRSLSLRDFVRFMRLHREGQMRTVKDKFNQRKGREGVMDEGTTRSALTELAAGETANLMHPEHSKLLDRDFPLNEAIKMRNFVIEAPVTYEKFVAYAEEVRNRRCQELRKRAGFTDVEITRFERLFEEHDLTRNGFLNGEEVTRLVMTLGFQLKTVEDQKKIVTQLNSAKKVAADQGLCFEDGKVDFWVVVQLLRGLYRLDDKKTLIKVTRAAEQSRFQAQEVAEFQEVFLNWYQRDQTRYAGGPEPSQGEGPRDQEGEEIKALSKSSLLRLLRSLGLKIEGPNRSDFEKKLAELSEHPLSKIDFADFMRLMRWMLDTNFCDIKKVACGG